MTGTDFAAAHRDVLDRLPGLLRTCSDAQLGSAVAACPHWTVLDVARHLTGLAVDFAGPSMPGPEDWAEEVMDRRHVDARRTLGLEEILGEWQHAAPGLEGALGTMGPAMAGAVAGEYACHEHDIRAAVGMPGARTSLATEAALDSYVTALLRRAADNDLAPLAVRAGVHRWAGDASDANVVAGEPFEIFRAVTGRRTLSQIDALDWTGRPTEYHGVFSSFGIPDGDIGD